ncbi:MAG TPA: DUF5683 domain-containing protein [Terriglobales bacterium]|nr:DUF5683 domain-containing protein [Terriglobales bacterium]
MKSLQNIICLFFFVFLFALPSNAISQEITKKPAPADSVKLVVLKSKSPMGALYRSVVFPGWGQLYNRKYFKAGLAFGAEVTFLTLLAIEWKKTDDQKKIFDSLPLSDPNKSYEYNLYTFYRNQRSFYLWSSLATIFISMFDAYVDAQLYDFDREMKNIGLEIHPEKDKRLGLRFSFNF